ncbi:MAG: PPC domain-containing protein [Usitatibacter sp.]
MRLWILFATTLLVWSLAHADPIARVEGRDVASDLGSRPLESNFRQSFSANSAPTEIVLPAPNAAETSRLDKPAGVPLIGVPRANYVAALTKSARALMWQPALGGRVATVAVQSSGAAALRVGIRVSSLPKGMEIRDASRTDWRSGGKAQTLSAPLIATLYGTGSSLIWTPVTSSDTQVIELFVPDGSGADPGGIAIENVSHLLIDPFSAPAPVPLIREKLLSCEENYSCATDPTIQTAGRAVAKIVLTLANGDTVSCSGALLNDRGSTGTPWFATAAHCGIKDQSAASGLQFVWYYELLCGTTNVSPNYTTTVGAQYLLWDSAIDFSFLKILGPIPSGLRLLGWDPSQLTPGTSVFGVHHPAGYYKAYSQGATGPIGPISFSETGTLFHISSASVSWTFGDVEQGSSGSPLMTSDGSFRGTLSAVPANASCSQPVGFYAQFAEAYPEIRTWIDPTTTPTFAHSASQTLSVQPTALLSTTQTGYLASSTDDNWFRFSIPQTGYWLFGSTYATGASTNTFGWLYASDGTTLLDSSASHASTPNFFLFGRVLQPGTFFVRVTGASGSFGPYILQSLFEPDDPDGNGGFPWVGTQLSPNGSSSGAIVRPGDVDFFIVDLPTAGMLTVQSTGTTDTVGYLFDSNVNKLDTNDDTSPSNLNFSMQDTLPAGRYYVGVVGYDVTTLGNYGISASFTPSSGVNANTPGPLSGLWWNPNESGWGIAFTQRRNIVFGAWYTYDNAGRPKWYVAANCPLPSGDSGTSGTCTGSLYQVTGPTFFGATFNSALDNVSSVGSLTVSFQSASAATMSYTVGGQSRTVSIIRQVFQSGTTPPAVDYTDLWWNPNESGWGMEITQQYGVMFLAWYVYDSGGNPVWYVAPDCIVQGSSCTGTVYSTLGPPLGPTFNPSAVQALAVGTITATFTDANNGTLTYTIGGVQGSKAITRQLF